jgi:hypothetical protein
MISLGVAQTPLGWDSESPDRVAAKKHKVFETPNLADPGRANYILATRPEKPPNYVFRLRILIDFLGTSRPRSFFE